MRVYDLALSRVRAFLLRSISDVRIFRSSPDDGPEDQMNTRMKRRPERAACVWHAGVVIAFGLVSQSLSQGQQFERSRNVIGSSPTNVALWVSVYQGRTECIEQCARDHVVGSPQYNTCVALCPPSLLDAWMLTSISNGGSIEIDEESVLEIVDEIDSIRHAWLQGFESHLILERLEHFFVTAGIGNGPLRDLVDPLFISLIVEIASDPGTDKHLAAMLRELVVRLALDEHSTIASPDGRASLIALATRAAADFDSLLAINSITISLDLSEEAQLHSEMIEYSILTTDISFDWLSTE
jgi:hypothetical protein